MSDQREAFEAGYGDEELLRRHPDGSYMRLWVNDEWAGFQRGWQAAIAHAVPEWLPIGTAPKDGRIALVYRPLAKNSHDAPVEMKRLIGGNNHCWECTVPDGETPTNPTDGACHVTHWMPLPAAPVEAQREKQEPNRVQNEELK